MSVQDGTEEKGAGDRTLELFSATANALGTIVIRDMLSAADGFDRQAVSSSPLDALFLNLTAAQIRWLACAMCGVNPR